MNSYQQADNHIAPIIKPLEVVGGLFSNYNLDKFTVRKSASLFPLSAKDISSALKDKRCIICLKKLYLTRDGKIWRCKSKANDKFIVKAEVMAKYE